MVFFYDFSVFSLSQAARDGNNNTDEPNSTNIPHTNKAHHHGIKNKS
jgi:hypothetical protein